jgi:hypothetical protein
VKPLLRAAALTAVIALCSAHIGSPDAWYEGTAGPYRVLVQVVTPNVVPGIATVYARVFEDDVQSVSVQTNRFDAVNNAPPPESARPVKNERGLFRAPLWVMSGGSNGITVYVSGARGRGSAVIPIVVVPTKRLDLDKRLGTALSLVLVFLVIGGISIIGAAVREGVLIPGAQPDPARKMKARWAMGVAAAAFALLLFGGMKWWSREDARFIRSIYKPFPASASVITPNGVPTLDFAIADSIWRKRNDSTWLAAHGASKFTPLILDHGKLMHLFVVKDDDLAAFAHLHPRTADSVDFLAELPPLPSGRYRVYGDIVHESGFTQTLFTKIDVSAHPAADALTDSDDAWFVGQPSTSGRSVLADGSVMTLARGTAPLVAGGDANLRFAVRDAAGKAIALEPYIGMSGHAVVTRDDGSVFVHLHPSGTISIASQMTFLMRRPGDSIPGTLSKRMTSPSMSGMAASGASDGFVSFPYAFPRPGKYHVWVQVKHAAKILTGAFALEVLPAQP